MLGNIVNGFSLQKIKLGHHRKSSPLDCRIRRTGGRRIARRIGGCSSIRYGAVDVLPKKYKACEYCHVNPAGGGVLNAIGKQYEANGHTFKK